MSKFNYERYEDLDYAELEVELSKLTTDDRVAILQPQEY